MPFTDPMADGPAIQASSLRALKAGQTLDEDARDGARLPQGRRRDADRADGLLQSDLHLRRRPLPRRRQGGRRRRPDRGRSAARGGRRAVPAGAQGRASTSSASPRPPPTTSACRRCSPIRRASSTTCRSPASPARPRPTRRRVNAAVARIKRHTKLPVAVGFGVRTAEHARAIAAGADGVVVGSALDRRAQAKPRRRQQGDGARPRRRWSTWSPSSPRACAAPASGGGVRHETFRIMTTPGFALFDTAIGRCGIAWSAHGVIGVQLPEANALKTRARLLRR